MSDSPTPEQVPVSPHRRRPRYSGKNPRRFEDKYKERDPARYAATVAKVLASGKTPAGTHRPIMVAEILEVLHPQPGEIAVDCTLGYGGHARELLAKLQPGGRLIGLDVDPIELPKTEARLRAQGLGPEIFVVHRSNFAGLPKVLAIEQVPGVDIILVADFNAWNLGNPRERFWASRTKQLHRAHVTTYDRLWSCLPYLRPMLTITADTIHYGRDEDGAGCHDLLGTRCDPYVHKLLNGEDFDLCCHSNLVRAVAPFHLTELDVHDVLNVFQVTGLTPDGRYFVKASPARTGDFIEFFAEIDVLCAISTCPHGDLSVPVWGPDAGDPLATCRPLGVEIWQPDPALLTGWQPPAPADYRGDHGLGRG